MQPRLAHIDVLDYLDRLGFGGRVIFLKYTHLDTKVVITERLNSGGWTASFYLTLKVQLQANIGV